MTRDRGENLSIKGFGSRDVSLLGLEAGDVVEGAAELAAGVRCANVAALAGRRSRRRDSWPARQVEARYAGALGDA